MPMSMENCSVRKGEVQTSRSSIFITSVQPVQKAQIMQIAINGARITGSPTDKRSPDRCPGLCCLRATTQHFPKEYTTEQIIERIIKLLEAEAK